jgi:hypothetical protein
MATSYFWLITKDRYMGSTISSSTSWGTIEVEEGSTMSDIFDFAIKEIDEKNPSMIGGTVTTFVAYPDKLALPD